MFDERARGDVRAMPSVVTRLAGLPFAALAAARGSRPFHPQGLVARGTWRIDRDLEPAAGAAVLRAGTEHDALIRLSRGVGLPGSIPDIYGIAVRIRDVGGPGREQDLLFNTTIDAPVLHHLLVPARSWFGASYTTSLPYRAAGLAPQFLVGLVPPKEGTGPSVGALRGRLIVEPVTFSVAVAPLNGRWRRIGALTVEEEVPGADPAFTPDNDDGGLVPAGLLHRWRRAAYRESQRARAV